MKDKLKTLIKTLPEVEPKEPVETIIRQIIGREWRRLWEKRISLTAGGLIALLGILAVRQLLVVAGLLGTAGFWGLLSSDWQWLAQDSNVVWSAFLEAHPLKEIGLLFLLVAIFSFSVYIFLREDD